MKGKALARVTLRTYLGLWLMRLVIWGSSGGTPWSLHDPAGWAVTATTVVFLMCVANVLVIAGWNLSACLRESRDEAAEKTGQASWEVRPGGVHIVTSGGQVKYYPGFCGIGPVSDRPRYHIHPVAGYNDLGHYMDLGDEICNGPACARTSRGNAVRAVPQVYREDSWLTEGHPDDRPHEGP